MNRAHVATRVSVIRKFLLFKEGDPYDPGKLEETEKNLRELGFLKSAAVTAGAPHGGLVEKPPNVPPKAQGAPPPAHANPPGKEKEKEHGKEN